MVDNPVSLLFYATTVRVNGLSGFSISLLASFHNKMSASRSLNVYRGSYAPIMMKVTISKQVMVIILIKNKLD